VAISTAIGEILIFDPSLLTLEETISFSSGKLALSSDGSVLGASADAMDYQYRPDRTLNFYSLPSGTVISSFPYTINTYPTLFDFTLAASGATIGRVTGSVSGLWTTARQVTDITGASAIWSDTEQADPTSFFLVPILLSPDGTLIGESAIGAPSPNSATNIIKNGTLVTAVPGVGVGWIDNDRILVTQWVWDRRQNLYYAGSVIYSSAGVPLATPLLPALKSIQTVTVDSVYSPASNTIYSLDSGQPIWTGSFPIPTYWRDSLVGAVAGSYVVYQSGHSVVVETY
jgi:hypothetical protein